MRLFLFILFGFLSNILFAQNNLYVAEFMEGVTLIKADSSGYYFAGNSKIFKTDLNTYPIWSKSYSNSLNSFCYPIKENGFLIARKVGATEFELIKIDENGAVVWAKKYTSADNSYMNLGGISISEDSKSNFFVSIPRTNQYYIDLLKIDSLGNLASQKKVYHYDFLPHTFGAVVKVLDNDHVVLLFDYQFLDGDRTYSLKLDNDLQNILFLSSFEFRLPLNENVLVSGNEIHLVAESITFGYDCFYTIDSTFNISDIRYVGQAVVSISSTLDKGFLFLSYTWNLVRLDSLYNVVWTKQLPSGSTKTVKECFNKSIIASGVYGPSTAKRTVFVKMDSIGNSACGVSDLTFSSFQQNDQSSVAEFVVLDTNQYSEQSVIIVESNSPPMNGYYICSTSIENEQLGQNSIGLYPNPFTRAIDLSVDEALLNNSEKKQLFVYNAIGELVLSEDNLISKMRIELNESTSGIYFVRLMIGEKQFVQKIIKE